MKEQGSQAAKASEAAGRTHKTLKVFRISKIHTEAGAFGLLDSGATHALRGRRQGESTKDLTEVRVTLACGRDATLKMTRGGTMIGQHEETEPIVPLGKMVSHLGCTVEWDEGGLVVNHPERGRLATTDRGGCPHIPRDHCSGDHPGARRQVWSDEEGQDQRRR